MKYNASILILALAASAAFTQTTPAITAKTLAAKPTAATVTSSATSAPAATPEKSTPIHKPVAAGRRDPFMNPVQNRTLLGVPCPTGKKCLVPGEVQLMGVIKYQNGMIALVENAQKKSYSLHENDPVFQGYVMKITLDSIIFKETTQDRLGKSSSREVVRKLTVPAV